MARLHTVSELTRILTHPNSDLRLPFKDFSSELTWKTTHYSFMERAGVLDLRLQEIQLLLELWHQREVDIRHHETAGIDAYRTKAARL